MQDRHLDRRRYFNELANTSREFYIDYLAQYVALGKGCRVLEVGCGEGGNLLPFAEVGCNVTGIDRSESRILQANSFFADFNSYGRFIPIDFFEVNNIAENKKFDLIIVNDVIEHISQKDQFLVKLKQFVSKEGIVFWKFPAWQMPFGGHQQICSNNFLSKIPFIHLLSVSSYRWLLNAFGETPACVDELLDIKECGISIEKFEKLLQKHDYTQIDRCLWFINPHYKQKFRLVPLKLSPILASIKYLRNFFTTSCLYITRPNI